MRQQAAEDGAFAARLLLACAVFAALLWFALPPCGQPREQRPYVEVEQQQLQQEQEEEPVASSLLGRGVDAAAQQISGRVLHTIHQYHAAKDVPERYKPLQVGRGNRGWTPALRPGPAAAGERPRGRRCWRRLRRASPGPC